ncbi:MAG: ribulose bisphosphate carboxylase small subunit [Gammaproteobacteria bacterium]|jgi:Ribulose bisphosphate carboxylase small subunit|nr:ribulose bisphosphate carboxylase small subunit [Gammaproteobacteria bacterium]
MAHNNEIGDYQTAQTLETFGFLPKFSREDVYSQIEYLLAQGWTPAIEHEHPSQCTHHYWTMWKLPMFGERDLGTIVQELEACRRAYPDHHIRLLGYDAYTQSQGLCFVVYEANTR